VTNHQPTDPPKPYGITSQVEDAEIVPWLRINAEHASRASHPSWLMFCVAADAIERLTTERDEARLERDQIRQNLCKVLDPKRPLTAEEMARLCWDCCQNLRLPQFSKTDEKETK
jgi:hypothetical protein